MGWNGVFLSKKAPSQKRIEHRSQCTNCVSRWVSRLSKPAKRGERGRGRSVEGGGLMKTFRRGVSLQVGPISPRKQLTFFHFWIREKPYISLLSNKPCQTKSPKPPAHYLANDLFTHLADHVCSLKGCHFSGSLQVRRRLHIDHCEGCANDGAKPFPSKTLGAWRFGSCDCHVRCKDQHISAIRRVQDLSHSSECIGGFSGFSVFVDSHLPSFAVVLMLQ